MLVLVRTEAFVGMGRAQVGGQVEVHQLAGEAGSRPEGAQLPPGRGPVAGLLLELATRRELRVLDRAGRRVDVERPGRDLEQDTARRRAVLADQEDLVVGIDRDDRDGTRMTGDIALGPRPVRALDGVDPERQVAAPMEDPRFDDPLDEVVGGRGGVDRTG